MCHWNWYWLRFQVHISNCLFYILAQPTDLGFGDIKWIECQKSGGDTSGVLSKKKALSPAHYVPTATICGGG
jgi:hypothetical protein